jgi:osmotically-inducible protein OsmY
MQLAVAAGVSEVAPTSAARIERQLAESGLQVNVEETDGSLVLTGIVDTAEAREAAAEIAASVLPDRRIDNQLEVETVLPTDIDDFVGDEAQAELPESLEEITASGGEIAPDFTDQPILRDPIGAVGDPDSDYEDPVASGDAVYEPPTDPVVTTNARGEAVVLGGFGTDAEVPVEASAQDGLPGDEALADAIRQELREDAATTDLQILVAVRRGVAHLRGRVSGPEDAENAEAVAARVPGIREVVEELDVASL